MHRNVRNQSTSVINTLSFITEGIPPLHMLSLRRFKIRCWGRMNNGTGSEKCGINNSLANSLTDMRMWALTKLSWDKFLYQFKEAKMYGHWDTWITRSQCPWDSLLWQSPKPEKNPVRLISQTLVVLSISYPRTCWPLYWVASSGDFVQSKKILQRTRNSVSIKIFCYPVNTLPRDSTRGCQINIGGLSQQGNQVKFQTLGTYFKEI